MTNNRFIKTLTIVLLLFLVILGGSGCGGGSSAPINENEPDNSITVPDDEMPDDENEISPDPIVNPEPTPTPTPTPTPNSESELEFGLATYSVVFDSDGGTEIEEQTVVEEGNAIRPNDPEKDGYVFLSWRDDEGYIYDFEAPVYSNIFLTAEWGKLETLTNEEAELFNEAYIGGETFISFNNSPIASVDVKYMLDGIGTVEISEVTNNPMCNTAGLIGSPVEITAIGANVENAEIIFHYDPLQINGEPDDLSIAWYDSMNDKIVLLSDDTVIDKENSNVKILVNHFSKYCVVDTKVGKEAMEKVFPTIVDAKKHQIIMLFDCSSHITQTTMNIAVKSAQNLVDMLSGNDYLTVVKMANSLEYSIFDKQLNTASIKSYVKSKLSLINPEPFANSKVSQFNNLLTMNFSYTNMGGYDNTFFVLFSDGSIGDVIDNNLKNYKNAGIKFITIGVGNVTNDSVMKHIAEATDGTYIYAGETYESFNKDFSETVAYQTLRESIDTDGDGLCDFLETNGMRDQYGRMWFTNFELIDTDGDNISDDAEMGKYFNSFVPYYFKRLSNPNKITKTENSSFCTLPSKVSLATKHRGEKMLYITLKLSSFVYKDFNEYEAFFQPVEKIDFDITDLPEGFELKTKKTTVISGNYSSYIDKDYITSVNKYLI